MQENVSNGLVPNRVEREPPMSAQRPIELLRPGRVPDPCYSLGRDYAVPLLTRRAFGRCDRVVLARREILPCRLDPGGLAGSRRPPG